MTDTAPPAAPAGPDPGRWINRFARFAHEVPDVRRDGESIPAETRAPHPFGTDLPAQPLPEPHWVAASDDCAALLGWPAD